MKQPPPLDDPLKAIQKLANDLRDPDEGCPWDVKQTHLSVVENLIEESYEVAGAIENLDPKKPATVREFKEELGDLLFQVVFHSQMASEVGHFNLDDVALAATEKLIFRHPHVYGDAEGKNADEVLSNWEALKRKEKEGKNQGDESMLSGIPGALPALLKSYRMGHKVSRVNFDWVAPEGTNALHDKVQEEYQEFLAELPSNATDFKDILRDNGDEHGHDNKMAAKKERAEEEVGDLLFVIAQLARHYYIDPEFALQKANRKFQSRFEKMESVFRERLSNHDFPSLDEWEVAWSDVKKHEKLGKQKNE
ncbi:MAG: nucleoside triphosphate pyrophosphohydrolase [Leptospirales bacterium]